MTAIEQFADNLDELELTLASMMESYSNRYAFTAEKIAKLNQRIGDPNHRYSNLEPISGPAGEPINL